MLFSFKDDSKLIEQLMIGNENAYTYLVTNYHKPLYIYALSLTNDNASAQDIIQNVFLRTWKFRKRLNPDFSIKNFLYKTTYNEFINDYHKTKAISLLERTYIEALNESIDENNSELIKKKIDFVNDGISNLPPKCKKTFLLSKKEGLTNIEISEYLDISIKTVEGHISKAYSILRKKCGGKLSNILIILFNNKQLKSKYY
ncbi:sigma-70 family RNA polymerase sigma factor [Aureibaculum sp. A20]|uniref:Sigma-70 family RNA polymerase sigma factor n=1 Tax=Aureibaculum flavum TaxID=2795986 RepID=A0ABS0WNS4_9FLAO|nr:sigma-70 family RNA polymerase sigma factor [Aureibaculum flavum]MBJ2173621.1 sigma-70 family RNA polymerase sigma factor [Aureibaculum flavum]